MDMDVTPWIKPSGKAPFMLESPESSWNCGRLKGPGKGAEMGPTMDPSPWGRLHVGAVDMLKANVGIAAQEESKDGC